MPTWMLIWRRSLCAVSGALAGAFVGLLFGLFQTQTPVPTLVHAEIVRVTLMLGIPAWLMVLLVVGIWARYGVLAILLPSLVNALITSYLTILIANKVQHAIFAIWIGILVGTIVGALLCRLCGQRQPVTGGLANGMR